MSETQRSFSEPWEAQAFALATSLVDDGLITAEEWAQTLGDEIKRAQASGDPDDGSTYYRHWLAALERLTREKNLLADQDISRRAEEWRDAYLATPHGQPVKLENR